jgi:hypothetical protein
MVRGKPDVAIEDITTAHHHADIAGSLEAFL